MKVFAAKDCQADYLEREYLLQFSAFTKTKEKKNSKSHIKYFFFILQSRTHLYKIYPEKSVSIYVHFWWYNKFFSQFTHFSVFSSQAIKASELMFPQVLYVCTYITR